MKKEAIINKIRAIIKEHGGFSPSDVNSKQLIIDYSIDNEISVLALYFDAYDIEISVHKKSVLDYDYIGYDELKVDQLKEILFLAEQYKTDCEKALKRCE